jgi:hypothetical protein
MNPTSNPNQPVNAGPRYNKGIIGILGGQPNNSMVGTLYNAWQDHKMNQEMNAGMERNVATSDPSDPASVVGSSSSNPMPMSPGTAMQPSPQSMSDAMDLASDSFAQGKMVTSPTIARLGEAGPEMVIPMSAGPHDKTMGAQLTDQPIATPKTLGGSARARYRHPTAAVALSNTRPISGDLPLKPNSAIR